MEKKYRTVPDGNMLRIFALKDFGGVRRGNIGGLIEKEDNLSHEGDCWIHEDATVSGDAHVSGHAEIFGHAMVCGKAWIHDNARVYGNAEVSENAMIGGNARVYGDAHVSGHAEIFGYARISENAKVFGSAKVYGSAVVWGSAEVYGDTWVSARVSGNVKLHSNIVLTNIRIENNREYIMLGIENWWYAALSNISTEDIEDFSTAEKNYLKNIQTIRQLYEKEI